MNFSISKFFKGLKKKRKSGVPGIGNIEGGEMTIADFIAPASVKIEPELIHLGERLAKSLFIFSYPRYLSTGWVSPVINLSSPLTLSFFIHPMPTGYTLKQLEKKTTEIQAELAEREKKGLITDPKLETSFRDIEDLRMKLQTAQERMFRVALYITIYGDTEKELRDVKTTIRSILESKLVYIKPAIYQQKEAFNSCLPYGLDKLSIHTSMNTSPLSSIFPFVSPDLSANEGVLYGINQHNSSLVLFDRFNLENANFVVFAKSGSGKSILGSEPVLIKNGGKIELAKIGPFIEKLIKKSGLTKIDDELEGVINPGIEVYSFDKNLRGKWSPVTVAARKKAPKIFYKFTTQSGREITTTACHNILTLKKGKVVAVKSSEVNEGDFIPLPRKIEIGNEKTSHLSLLGLLKKSKGVYVAGGRKIIEDNYYLLKEKGVDKRYDQYLYRYRQGRRIPIQYFAQILKHLNLERENLKLRDLKIISKNGKGNYAFSINFKLTEEFAKIIGYISAEGTITERAIIISNTDVEILKDIKLCLRKLRVPFYYYGDREIIIASRIFVETIKALGGKEYSGQKKVLPVILSMEKEKIAQYLSAYFEGDGGVEKHRFTVSAVSKSKRLVSEIAYLLYYFGIVARIKKTKKRPSNYNWKRNRVYYVLTISGQDNLRKFAENINFISAGKKKQLSGIIKKEGNTNVDIIPQVESIFREIYHLFGPQLHRIQDISNIKGGHYNPSAEKLRELIKLIKQRVQRFKGLASTYKILSELPELSLMIDLGKNKKLNRTLWQELGQSWRVVKQEMDLPIKYYNRSLETALISRPKSNPSYEMIQKAAQYIWQNYQEILEKKIPLVEEKLTQLEILANSDIFWDPIVKIEKIKKKKEKYVYDLTVDDEVFLAGRGGMFVHNSYAVKLEALRYLMLGVECIIIDPENEYKPLAEAAGGSFIDISLSSPNHINPFDLPETIREDERPEDVLRSNVINLVGLMRLMLGGLTPEEDAIMDRALTETYAAKDIAPETDPATWQAKVPLMEDLEQVLMGMEGGESLVKRLRKFTKGTYADFFNQPTNISMNKPLVVFGIRDVEDELRPMAMFIIMRHIWNKVRSELKKRILVVDEAWWLMKNEDSASFLFGMCKRARKYWLGVTTITQDVGDFMRSTYGPPIITNSALQFLMKQSPATIDVVKETFNLTEGEKEFLLGMAVGEGLFFAGPKHVLLRVVASEVEHKIITTSPEELLEMREKQNP